MSCHDVQLQLSLYLYGELDFAAEEAVETHLAECAFCQRALAREKTWHSEATSEYRDVPLELLTACRQDLRLALSRQESVPEPASRWRFRWPAALHISPTRWSYQLAVASFLVFVGFTGGRYVNSFLPAFGGELTKAGFLNPATARIRDIQPNGSGRVRILLDEMNQREVVGSPDDQNIKRWLLVAIQDASDPGIRVDSVEALARQSGNDVRDALLGRIERDPNAAVRLKALESLRRFSDDPAARNVLRSVLEHDVDPAVRLEAIDILAPLHERSALSPELTLTLQGLARSERDEYVRNRCQELLRLFNAPSGIY